MQCHHPNSVDPMILPEIVLLTTRAYERVNAELIAREAERARRQDLVGSPRPTGRRRAGHTIRRAVRRAILRARVSLAATPRRAGGR